MSTKRKLYVAFFPCGISDYPARDLTCSKYESGTERVGVKMYGHVEGMSVQRSKK